MKNLWKKIFNLNGGYHIETINYGNLKHYIIYRKHVYFGMPGLSKITICSSKEQLDAWMIYLEIEDFD